MARLAKARPPPPNRSAATAERAGSAAAERAESPLPSERADSGAPPTETKCRRRQRAEAPLLQQAPVLRTFDPARRGPDD